MSGDNHRLAWLKNHYKRMPGVCIVMLSKLNYEILNGTGLPRKNVKV